MEIYVRVHSNDDGTVAWWNSNELESYLMGGKDLWCYDNPHGDYCRGTPFNTVKEAKRQAREAVEIAGWDGMVKPKATFWRYVRGKLVQTKFTRDNKIKMTKGSRHANKEKNRKRAHSSLADVVDNELAKAVDRYATGKEPKSPFTHKWKSKLGTAECDDVFWDFLHSN